MSPLDEASAFIERMRALGAVRVRVGETFVEFGTAMEPVEPPPPVLTDEELKEEAKKLLYASSD